MAEKVGFVSREVIYNSTGKKALIDAYGTELSVGVS
ncbi:hypothetical protein ACVWXS_005322 [Lysinibacillus sp. TE18511]